MSHNLPPVEDLLAAFPFVENVQYTPGDSRVKFDMIHLDDANGPHVRSWDLTPDEAALFLTGFMDGSFYVLTLQGMEDEGYHADEYTDD